MDALISLVYTIIDSVCVCLFLDAFASHRWRNHRFLVGVIVQTILMYASIEFSVIALNRNQIVKILLILLSCFIVARTLYENISGKFLLFLIVVEYLLTYSLSFVSRNACNFGLWDGCSDVSSKQDTIANLRNLLLFSRIIYYCAISQNDASAYGQQTQKRCSTFAADTVLSISMRIVCNACDSTLRYKWSQYRRVCFCWLLYSHFYFKRCSPLFIGANGVCRIGKRTIIDA